MQFGQGHLFGWLISALQLLEVLGKARVHVVGVDLAGVDFGDVAVDVERDGLAGTATARAQFLVALQQRQVLQLRDGQRNRLLGIRVELVDRLVPGEALNLGGLQDGAEPVELFREGRPRRQVVGQLGKVGDARRAEDSADLGEAVVQALQVPGQLVGKEANGLVTRVHLHRRTHVALHRVRLAVVADRAKWLVWPEQPVGA
ncbi:hypothetical protein D3C77_480970 [compost metagenome]